MACFPQKRLADKCAVLGDRDEGNRIEAVFDGEGFRLVQSVQRDRRDMYLTRVNRPVERKFVKPVWCCPVQLLAHGLGKIVAGSALGIECQVFDLIVRDHQFGAQPFGFKRDSLVAEHLKIVRQAFAVCIRFADKHPSLRGAVQQADAFHGQG